MMSKSFKNARSVEEIVSDKEIEEIWGNANFGAMSKRDVVKYALLKVCSGFRQGHTATVIITELGLVTMKYRLTKKGERYLYYAFKGSSTI
jgi:hypothetical protein